MDSSGKKKPNLPHGWTVEPSKTYPDRVYYFNVLTGATSWKCPLADSAECVELPKNMRKNKKTPEADTSTSVEPSKVLQQEKADGSTEIGCKRRITYNELTETISPVSGDSKVIASPKRKTVTPPVPSKSPTKRRRKLKRPVLKDNNISAVNSNKPERIILKAKRVLEHSKSEVHVTKKVTVPLSSSNATKPTSTLSASSGVESSSKSPTCRGKHINNVVNKNIINLKDTKSRFRQPLDQRLSSLDDELFGDVSSSGISEYYDQDVEMPDLSELLTNEDLPEPMQVEEIPFDNGLYIIVDTNVFLRNLKYIKSLMETSFEGWGYPNIRIPWAVIQELDALKNNKNGKGSSTVHKAAEAVRFVYRMLQCRHPRIRGQTAADASKSYGNLNAECNDDKILQYCIQLAESVGKRNVILLTEDKNLCNKAFINDIDVHIVKTLQKDLKVCHHEKHDDKLEQEEEVLAEKTNSNLEQEKTEDHKHRTQLEDLVNEAKVTIKDLLSIVVESEMKQAFDDIWTMIIFRKPPWTLLDVLECILRHWMAVFGFLFQRDMKSASEELLSLLKHGCDPVDKREVTKLFDLTSTICTCIYIKYGSESADRSLNQLEEIKKKWQNLYMDESKLGTQDSESIVYASFNYVWTVINNTCGIIQDVLNYQCGITYEKPSVFPSREEIVQLLPKFHKKLEHLHQEMSSIITSTVIDANYQKSIFEFLITFRTFAEHLPTQLPSFPSLKQITPEMLEKYCTSTKNKEKLTYGHYQLKYFLSTVERIAKEVFL